VECRGRFLGAVFIVEVNGNATRVQTFCRPQGGLLQRSNQSQETTAPTRPPSSRVTIATPLMAEPGVRVEGSLR